MEAQPVTFHGKRYVPVLNGRCADCAFSSRGLERVPGACRPTECSSDNTYWNYAEDKESANGDDQ